MIVRGADPAADAALARALLAVQHDAYADEARLIGDDRIPPLHEDLADLRAAPLRWLVAVSGDRLLGAAAWTEDAASLDIDRLIVARDARRRGVAGALVGEVLLLAGARATTVSTGRDNFPARALYDRSGFRAVREQEVAPGLWVTHYTRDGADP